MRLVLLFSIATALYAQPGLTRIVDTLYMTDGSLFSGNLQIQSQSFSSTGNPILEQYKTLKIKSGALDVSLVPNDTSTPPRTSYVFNYQNGTVMTCVIPTSVNPIRLTPYCTYNSPTPPLVKVLWPQLDGTGLTNGTYCITVVNQIPTGLVPCTGGGGAGTWNTLTASWSTYTGTWSTYH